MRCEWVKEYDSVLDALTSPEVVLLSAVGTAENGLFKHEQKIGTLYRNFSDTVRITASQ